MQERMPCVGSVVSRSIAQGWGRDGRGARSVQVKNAKARATRSWPGPTTPRKSKNFSPVSTPRALALGRCWLSAGEWAGRALESQKRKNRVQDGAVQICQGMLKPLKR